jgi:hypothetical protein
VAEPTTADTEDKTAERVGDCEVPVGTALAAFWSLDPSVDVSKTKPAIVASPVSGAGEPPALVAEVACSGVVGTIAGPAWR